MVYVIAIPFFLAAGLLAVSGAAKVTNPLPLQRATLELGMPAGRFGVRAFGSVEFVVGVAALVLPVPTSIAVACLYALFAGVLLKAMRSGVALTSCGCLGARETPPSVVHVSLNIAATSVSILVTFQSNMPSLYTFSNHLSTLAIPVWVGILSLGYMAYALVAYFPAAWNSYQSPQPTDLGRRPHAR